MSVRVPSEAVYSTEVVLVTLRLQIVKVGTRIEFPGTIGTEGEAAAIAATGGLADTGRLTVHLG